MDYDIVIFWFVVFSCLSSLIMVVARFRHGTTGWVVVYGAILLMAVMGWFGRLPVLVYASAGLWALFVLAPILIARVYTQRFLQQRYAAARRLAQIIRWLHPADGWREQPEIVGALELAERGELAAALEILQRFQNVKSLAGMAAMINCYRLTSQWEELLAWQTRHLQLIERHPFFLPLLLRTKGETGDVPGMIQLYDRHKRQIGRLVPVSSRDKCRLALFAFCGKRQAVENLFAGGLAMLPATTREFWLATADMTAGNLESAKQQFDRLLPVADPPLRLAIQRRLAQISQPPWPLDAVAERLVAEAAREQGHDDHFGARRSLFSKQARATWILIALNGLMFSVEIGLGGATNLHTLYRLGALFPPAVRAGEWWRLIAPLFLHYGWLHLSMNMLALWLLGPFVEFALGVRRYLFAYLLSGIGSLGVVALLHSRPADLQLTVGASGCIMGLVGATGALMLRAWRQHKALAARRRFAAMLLIVGMQTIFDSIMPQVSMTAHLSGAIIGFAITLLLRDRLVIA